MLSFLLSLGLGFGSIDQTELSAQYVEQIAREVIVEMKADMKTEPTLIVTERPEPTPLAAMAYANSKCVVIVNTNKTAWAQWGRFLHEGNRSQWPKIVAASVAHEIGHCLKESRQFTANFEISDDEFRGIQSTGNLGPKPAMVYKQELFADTVAILYAREHAGEQADEVIDAMIKARERYSANEPTHNTAKMLHRLIEQDTSRHGDEPMGVAANRLLSML